MSLNKQHASQQSNLFDNLLIVSNIFWYSMLVVIAFMTVERNYVKDTDILMHNGQRANDNKHITFNDMG